MTPRIAIEGLRKSYNGRVAVENVTFTVEPGSVVGLLGLNGAGKTTTFKCALGLAHPDAGSIRFDGEPLAPQTFRRLAYVPETVALYDEFTGMQHARMWEIDQPAFDRARFAQLAERFAFDPRKKVRALSKGQKTALSLCLAFASQPEILILDEPGSGLDPLKGRILLDLVFEAAFNGAAVLFSSHEIGQVERAADRVVVIADGRVALDGALDDLKADRKIVEAVFTGAVPAIVLNGATAVTRTEVVGRTLRAFTNGDESAVRTALAPYGPVSIRTLDLNLEDLFFEAVTHDL